MPIFKEFVNIAVKKKDARPFKVADNITMMVIDPKTGKKASFGTKKTIIEAGKSLFRLLNIVEVIFFLLRC